jgi:dienelactone hydrolase
MNKTLTTLLVGTVSTLALGTAAQASPFDVHPVSFMSGENRIAANLYVPAQVQGRRPAVVVTGSWTSVKEQNPAQYAERLAARGYIVLTMDHTGFGASDGAVRTFENPFQKVADVKAGITFLTDLEAVDSGAINGLGICAGGGYMARVAAEDGRLNAVATVAGWYTDQTLYRGFFGAGYQALAQAGDAADRRFHETGEVVTRAAVSDGSTPAAMSVQIAADYYDGRARLGGWTNSWADMSYKAIFAFETIPLAGQITAPALVVHADNAITPDAARRHFAAIGTLEKELVWLGDANQFQFYDDPAVVERAADAIATWFGRHR